MRNPSSLLCLLLLAACGETATQPLQQAVQLEQAAALSNQDVYNRLTQTCAGCHGAQTLRPYFSSLAAFENLLAYDVRYVVAGKPEQSELIRLLLGQGTRVKQMPFTGDSFAQLEARGRTQITIAELRSWITNLPPRSSVQRGADVQLLRRKGAEEIVQTMYAQLGLDESDFFDAAYAPSDSDRYPIRSPDAIPRDDAGDSLSEEFRRFYALGGPGWLEGIRRRDEVGLPTLGALVHVTQAWCRLSLRKEGGKALLLEASLGDSSADANGQQRIRKNLAALHLKLLGQPAQDADVEDLFQSVFLAYEGRGAEAAWTAVCAALLRDPLWITY